MRKKEDRSIKIVALGDSLTEGFQMGLDFSLPIQSTPYTDHLRNLAQEHLDKLMAEVNLGIVNEGVCGDCTSDMLMRLQRDVLTRQPDYVIVLGGTNDVGLGISPAQVFSNLKTIYDVVEDNGISPLACTIPSILGFDENIPLRLQLNDMIRGEAERRTMPLIDFFEVTSDPENGRLLEKYSSDGLHLNAEGYRRMGELVFECWLCGVLDEYVGKT
jgi:lysophospholipase L1-like esterase